MAKLRVGQEIEVLDVSLIYQGSFSNAHVAWLFKVAAEIGEQKKRQLTVLSPPAIPTPCCDLPLNAAQYLVFKAGNTSKKMKAGKLFRIDAFPQVPLRLALSYKTKMNHCLIGIKLKGSQGKKDVVQQLTSIMGKGTYYIVKT